MALTLNRQSKLNTSFITLERCNYKRQSNGFETAPVLPAITLTSQCYKQMFSAFKKRPVM